jgi:mannose-1-phosphate guanylyltransferase
MTQALILAGGQGTRLRPLTCHTPKSMVPVINIPFLEHVLNNLKAHGITDVIFAQHHLPAAMSKYFSDGSKFGMKIHYVIEDSPLGTAGAIKNAEKFLNDTFFVLNGDIFQNRDFTRLLQFHRGRNARVTLVLTPVEDPTMYGVVETDTTGRVMRFTEKPKKEEVTTNMINAGTYVMEPEVLKRIPAGEKVSIERETFPGMLSEGQLIYGYNSHNYWMDTGTPEKYLQLHRDLLAGRCDGYVFEKDINAVPGSRIDGKAMLSGKVIIGGGSTIAAGAILKGPVVIGNDCRIEKDALVSDSVIWNGVHIEASAEITGSLIANDCIIGAHSRLDGAVIGDHINVPRDTRLEQNARLFPDGELP